MSGIVSVSLLSVLALSIWLWRVHERERAEEEQRDRLLSAMLTQVKTLVQPGLLRDASELRLRQSGLEFGNQIGPECAGHEDCAWSDTVSLGRRPSGVWYCGPVRFGVLVAFRAATHRQPSLDRPSPTDVATSVEPFIVPDDCL